MSENTETGNIVANPASDQPGRVDLTRVPDDGRTRPIASISWKQADRLATSLRNAARHARIRMAGLDPDKLYRRKPRGRVVWRVHAISGDNAYLIRVGGGQSTYESPTNLVEVRSAERPPWNPPGGCSSDHRG